MLPRKNLSLSLVCLSLNTVALADGGVSGGGGGSVPENPVGRYAVEEFLQDARGELLMFFNGQDRGLAGGLFSDLFHSSPNIYEIVRQTKIGIKQNGPCIGKDGKEYDGSVVGPDSTSICISTDQLGKKLTKDNAHRQTLALVAHEYAHLLGYDEDKAVKLQKFVIGYYEENVGSRKRGFFFEIVLPWRDMLLSLQNSIVNAQLSLFASGTSEDKKWIQSCTEMSRLSSEIGEALGLQSPPLREFLPFKAEEFSPLALDLQGKAWALSIVACGQKPETEQHENEKWAYRRYLKAFRDHATLSVGEFRRMFFDDSNFQGIEAGSVGMYSRDVGSLTRQFRDSGVLVHQVDSLMSAQVELRELSTHLESIGRALDEFGIPSTVIEF
jgi:hypothetical protein